MLLGNSETIPVVDGELMLGTWQSVMLVELDGPRTRTIGVHVAGVRVNARERRESRGYVLRYTVLLSY